MPENDIPKIDKRKKEEERQCNSLGKLLIELKCLHLYLIFNLLYCVVNEFSLFIIIVHG